MTRYGPQVGPDITFLGVPRCDLDDPQSYASADVVILGAPFDGGTSHRPGARFGPMAIRMTDYLPQDGSRPSLALRTDALVDLTVVDAGDVEMYSGDIEKALPALEAAVEKVTRAVTGSCRSGYAATGPRLRRWTGWPVRECAPTR